MRKQREAEQRELRKTAGELKAVLKEILGIVG
jgi:hypothetical protein